jgi:hypothetical protein
MNVSTRVILIISLLLTFLNTNLFSQAPDTLWTKTFGEYHDSECNDVHQTSDGGYILVGNTNKLTGLHQDVWIIKTDALGDTLWTKISGGSDSDIGNSVQQTTDGGYIIAGITKSFGAGGQDVWQIKTTPDASDIEQNAEIMPIDFFLAQNFPNPFNPSTKIRYDIPKTSLTSLKVYDVLGNEIITLVNEEKPAGNYEVEFDAPGLPSGVYFYRLQAVPIGRQAGSFVETKKMVLMK